jgi:hypothetical protein
VRSLILAVAVLGLVACAAPPRGDEGSRQPAASPVSGDVDEPAFWTIVEQARRAGGGDPERMADVLTVRFAAADDETLRSFQERLVEASARLYTWRHFDAAEMICGFVSDDVHTDWRSWVITLGRDTYERIVEDPDNLTEIGDLSGGCEGMAEFFGAAVSEIWFERHGFGDETFPILEPTSSPTGEKLPDLEAVRASLPRLSARIPDDGLGRGPRQFDD